MRIILMPFLAIGFLAPSCSSSSFKAPAGGVVEDKEKKKEEVLPGSEEAIGTKDNGTKPLDPTISPTQSVTIEELCAKPEKFLKVTRSISFPEPPTSCDFADPINLPGSSSTVSAQLTQTVPLLLPENSVICGLSFNFPTQNIRYDDHMFINFNDVVLASTFTGLTTPLQVVNNLKIFDWTKIRGTKWPSSLSDQRPPYCIGGEYGTPACDIPKSQDTGKIQIQIPPDKALALSKRGEALKKYQFSIVGIGDNDPGKDCKHTAINFDVEIQYVGKP